MIPHDVSYQLAYSGIPMVMPERRTGRSEGAFAVHLVKRKACDAYLSSGCTAPAMLPSVAP
jgi:hypothetical protein